MPAAPLIKQVAVLLSKLEGMKEPPAAEVQENVLNWIKDLPLHVRSKELYTRIAKAFALSPEEVEKRCTNKVYVEDFETLVPKDGFLRDYVEYTRQTEPPTVFHFFVGATILGASLKRHVHMPRGDKNIFPNLCVILVAPSGKCRKTTACDLGVEIYRDGGGEVYADKLTPESLIDVDPEHTSVTGLIYSGELKQFLGSQKYMEGMIPLLTRLMDCPDTWSVKTVTRGLVTLNNVALSMLAASTMDWLKALPGDSFGGGFMSRFLLVVQEDTPRSFPIPPPKPDRLRTRLVNRLRDLSHLRSRMLLTENATRWYIDWYNELKQSHSDKLFSGYAERKPTQLLRMATLLSISEDDSTVAELRHLQHSLRILDWIEKQLPSAFEQLASTQVGEDQYQMLTQLRKVGGTITHSEWLRMNSSRLRAREFKELVLTLRTSQLVDYDANTGKYYLTTEGWKA